MNLTMRYITLTYNFVMKNKKAFWVCEVQEHSGERVSAFSELVWVFFLADCT